MKFLTLIKEEIDRQRFINSAINMDYSELDAEDIVDGLIEKYKTLPKKLTLYRIIRADEYSDIDLRRLGKHYSDNKEELLTNYEFSTGVGDKIFLFTVIVDKRFVDVQQSIENNILYPNENEITLKNEGKDVKIEDVEDVTNMGEDYPEFTEDWFLSTIKYL